MLCPKCHYRNDDSSSYCYNCGQDLRHCRSTNIEKPTIEEKPKKRSPLRVCVAIVVCLFFMLLWGGMGATLFGWKRGGGGIMIMIELAIVAWIWRAITKPR